MDKNDRQQILANTTSESPGYTQKKILTMVFRILIVPVGYYITGWLGLKIPYIGSQITLIWLPTGIAVAALLRWGWTVIPSIYLGALLINYTIAPSLPLASGIAIGNTIGPFLVALGLKYFGLNYSFIRRKDYILLLLVSSIGMTVSALGGVACLYLAGLLPISNIGFAWLTWWMGDSIGILLFTPFLLVVSRKSIEQYRKNGLEVLGWFICSCIVAYVSLGLYSNQGSSIHLGFLVLPMIIWAGLRFGIIGGSISGLFFSTIAAYATATGYGIFVINEKHVGLLLLWIFIVTIVVAGLMMAVIQADKVRADMELLESEKKYKYISNQLEAILDHIPGHVFYKDSNNNFIRVNKSIADEHGLEKAELEGKSMLDLYSKDDAERFYSIDLSVINTGKPSLNIEESENTVHGIKWNTTSKIPFKDENGNIVGIIGLSFDITERKQSEERLKESEERYKTLFDSSPAGILLTDEWGVIQDVNDAILKSTLYCREELIGSNIRILSYPENDNSFINNFKWILAGETLEHVETCRRKDGSSCTLEKKETAITMNNGQRAIISVSVDISERNQTKERLKESEQRYRILFETSPLGIILSDENGTIIEANNAVSQTTQYTHEELIGRNVRMFEWPEKRTRVDKNIKQILSGQILEQEILNRKKDGTPWTFLLKETTITLPNGSRGILSVTTDITLRKKAEDEIKQKNEELTNLVEEIRTLNESLTYKNKTLHELNATKDKFFSIIAHDLKSPFNSIIGFSEILADQVRQKDFDNIEEHSQIIVKSSRRAMALLLNLMEWSRSQTGRIKYNPEQFEMNKVITDMTNVYSDIAQNKSILIDNNLLPNPPIHADKSMINTILRNLISNAIKFTMPGGKITISTEFKQEQLTVSIADTGVGIPKAAINKLFKIDSDYSTDGTQEEQGTGLGLILCMEFIEKHSGKIWVESEEGKGSIFSFTLPYNIERTNTIDTKHDFN